MNQKNQIPATVPRTAQLLRETVDRKHGAGTAKSLTGPNSGALAQMITLSQFLCQEAQGDDIAPVVPTPGPSPAPWTPSPPAAQAASVANLNVLEQCAAIADASEQRLFYIKNRKEIMALEAISRRPLSTRETR